MVFRFLPIQVSRRVEYKEISLLKEPSAVIPCCTRSVSDVHIFSTVSITLIWETGFVQSFKGSIFRSACHPFHLEVSLGSEKPAL